MGAKTGAWAGPEPFSTSADMLLVSTDPSELQLGSSGLTTSVHLYGCGWEIGTPCCASLRRIGVRGARLEPDGVTKGSSSDHAKDFLERGHALEDLVEAVVAEADHALLARDALDGHGAGPLDGESLDLLGDRHDLMQSQSAAVSRLGASGAPHG